jgi:hypothetical protein
MSKTFKVSPSQKKSICTTEIFEKTVDGVTYRAELENWYRWGYAVISGVEDETELTENETLEVSGYSIEDHSFDDGVAAYWYYSSNITDEMKEEVETAWDEDWYDGVEEHGWTLIDTETYFHGPIEVEFVSEEVDEDEEEVDPSKPKWPF